MHLPWLTGLAVALWAGGGVASAQPADLVVRNAKVTTLDAASPEASAFAVRDGRFVAVGGPEDVAPLIGGETLVVDAGERRVIPGLIDSHMHPTRAARYYNVELRWDGVDTLARGLEMVREQAGRTPAGQWVRVIGAWSPYQFAERRMPTPLELSEAAGDVPTFVLFLYSQGFLNDAGVRALGLTPETQAPPGSRIEFVEGGAVLHAEPDPTLLYQTIGRLPEPGAEDQLNSARHFYRELSRFGLTSVIDAGGGGHNFPGDYVATDTLARSGELPVRISTYLFPQQKGKEIDEFRAWIEGNELYRQLHETLEHGYELEGGGEFLVWSAGDFENFMAPRPELADRGDWDRQLHAVTTLLVQNGWPLRIHATYGESIQQIMDVFERVAQEQGRFAPRWAIDHAETADDAQLRRIHAMGGGVAIQNRMAFAGEYFAERYGRDAAAQAPPIRRMLELGIPVGGGTDATRVSSHNPWLSLHWLVTGETLGGAALLAEENRLTREEALRLWTLGSAWFSQEETIKGRIAPGQLADFAVLDRDYFAVPTEEIRRIEAVLTVVGGEATYAAEPFAEFSPPPLPPVSPTWAPVASFGGYQNAEKATEP